MTTGLQALAGGRAGGRGVGAAGIVLLLLAAMCCWLPVLVFLAVQTLANRQSAVFISKACS